MGLFSFESKQVKEWKKLAKSGDMDAQYHLLVRTLFFWSLMHSIIWLEPMRTEKVPVRI